MRKVLIAGAAALFAQVVFAASGEMGTGIPNFGLYSQATGLQIRVWNLSSATMSFPVGCVAIILTPETMGMESYKMAFTLLTTAKLSGTRVRFYAHADRDGGCGVDYMQLAD
jgi:hypothetical protein